MISKSKISPVDPQASVAIDRAKQFRDIVKNYMGRLTVARLRSRPLDLQGLLPDDEESRTQLLLLAIDDAYKRSSAQAKKSLKKERKLSRPRIYAAVDHCAKECWASDNPLAKRGWYGKVAEELDMQVRTLNRALLYLGLSKEDLWNRWCNWKPKK